MEKEITNELIAEFTESIFGENWKVSHTSLGDKTRNIMIRIELHHNGKLVNWANHEFLPNYTNPATIRTQLLYRFNEMKENALKSGLPME